VETAFGGNADSSDPISAYMLKYRRYDPEINTLPCLYEELPSHIQVSLLLISLPEVLLGLEE
jgi:hypothetical protein